MKLKLLLLLASTQVALSFGSVQPAQSTPILDNNTTEIADDVRQYPLFTRRYGVLNEAGWCVVYDCFILYAGASESCRWVGYYAGKCQH